MAARLTRILVFAKAPVPGQVKTRLIPALGADGAAHLAAQMLKRTLAEALATDLGVELCGDPHPQGWYCGPNLHLAEQGPGDLGERLARAAERTLAGGENVLLIGADCPELDRHRLGSAADRLALADSVIHPAQDGGYALLGLRRFDPSLFAGIAWSTPSVCAETRARIAALGWTLHLAETLRDVDEPEDLALVGRG